MLLAAGLGGTSCPSLPPSLPPSLLLLSFLSCLPSLIPSLPPFPPSLPPDHHLTLTLPPSLPYSLLPFPSPGELPARDEEGHTAAEVALMSGHMKAFEMLVARSSSRPQAEEEEGGT